MKPFPSAECGACKTVMPRAKLDEGKCKDAKGCAKRQQIRARAAKSELTYDEAWRIDSRRNQKLISEAAERARTEYLRRDRP